MCGIFSVTENNPKLVTSIVGKGSYRGTDVSSIWLSENLTLGHNLF